MTQQRTRIAILGGGVGAMTTALYLTRPELRDQYQVTVYQLGWRLGGKGASGRNAEAHQRIEEHGIHVWSGLYDNAFRHMREAYAELGRSPGAPLATWRDAFKPVTVLTMMERQGDDWLPWTSVQPTNDQLPGDEDAHLMLPFWSYVGEGVQMARHWLRHAVDARHRHAQKQGGPLRRMAHMLLQALVVAGIEVGGALAWTAYSTARVVHAMVHRLAPDPVLRALHALMHSAGGGAAALLGWVARRHWHRVKDHMDDTEIRRRWVSLNVAVGILRGIHADDIVRRGFDAVDHLDFREWLSRHIVDDGVTLDSPMALFLYDADFAYEGGLKSRPRLSAGVALYSLFRLALTWKGATIWEMQAGMGDTVFTPFYRVLAARGVTFRFFSKVKQLHLSQDGASVAAITMARQARVADGEDRYRPLVEVNGLECWPSAPLWDQLVGGGAMRDAGADLEAWYGPEVEEYRLAAGEDFDQVVVGISLGGLPYVCGELIDASPAWRNMVRHVGTVRTLGAQFWFSEETRALGWSIRERGGAVSTYDASQFDSWAEMSHLIPREAWPESPGERPGSIAYICGPLPEEDPPLGRCQTPEELDQAGPERQVEEMTRSYLEGQAFRLYPHAAGPGSFRWEALLDPRSPGLRGPRRLVSQYIRANVQPTERYVLSLPGTTRHRLHPGASGFANVFLAGDWTWNSFNAGCVEAATISGMLAANAMCGSPPLESIVGLTFGHVGTPYDPRR